MTAFGVDRRYDVRVRRLALGVEPRDAVAGGRLRASVRVLVEDAPAPLDRWRTWRPGETLDDVLTGLDRHPSGRFGRVYRSGDPGGTVVLRIVDATRQIVPRRIEVDVAAESAVIAAEAAGTPHPLWRRVFPVGVFPGAAAAVGAGATVVRGRVQNIKVPVRWTRISAVDAAGAEIGWAHGDDRGEFVLVVGNPEGAVVVSADPLAVDLTVTARLPPPTPDPLDPLRAVVDRLWDLAPEPLTATPDPAADDRFAGRAALPGQTAFGPFPLTLPLGRETTTTIRIPSSP